MVLISSASVGINSLVVLRQSIIVGSKHYIEQIKKNPINRALRIDKFTLSSLESVLRLYLDESQAIEHVPTLRMIAMDAESIKLRVDRLCKRCLDAFGDRAIVEARAVFSQVGGGALPEQNLASWAVSLLPQHMKLSQVEQALRFATVPVMGRVEDEQLIFDLRTVSEEEEDDLFSSINEALSA